MSSEYRYLDVMTVRPSGGAAIKGMLFIAMYLL